MTDSLPHGIRIREGPGGVVRYRLPRCAGRVRKVAWGLVIVPTFLFAFFPLLIGLGWLFGGVMWFSLLPFAVVPLPWALGLWTLLGRQEVVLDAGRLTSVRRLGPLRRTWARPLFGLRRVVATSFGGKQPAELIAVFVDGPPLSLACLRDPACLAWLARDLARRVQADGKTVPEAAEESLLPAEERPDPPARSRVRVTTHDDGVVFDIPREGFGNGMPVLLLIAGLMLAGGVGYTAWWLWQRPVSVAPGQPWAIGLVFWVPGVAMLLALLWIGTRRVSLAVHNGCLWVQEIHVFGEREWHWDADELASLSVQYNKVQEGASFGSFASFVTTLTFLCRMEPGPHVAGASLKVQPRQGKPVFLALGCGLDKWASWADMEWLATRLRALLDVPAVAEEGGKVNA